MKRGKDHHENAKVGRHEKGQEAGSEDPGAHSKERGAKRNGTQIRHKHGGQVHSV